MKLRRLRRLQSFAVPMGHVTTAAKSKASPQGDKQVVRSLFTDHDDAEEEEENIWSQETLVLGAEIEEELDKDGTKTGRLPGLPQDPDGGDQPGGSKDEKDDKKDKEGPGLSGLPQDLEGGDQPGLPRLPQVPQGGDHPGLPQEPQGPQPQGGDLPGLPQEPQGGDQPGASEEKNENEKNGKDGPGLPGLPQEPDGGDQPDVLGKKSMEGKDGHHQNPEGGEQPGLPELPKGGGDRPGVSGNKVQERKNKYTKGPKRARASNQKNKNEKKNGKGGPGTKLRIKKRIKKTPEEIRETHRRCSKKWHDKWARKGVPKDQTGTKDKTATGRKKLPQEISDALVLDKMEGFMPVTNDLRKTKAAFVNAYVDLCNQQENQQASDGGSNHVMLTKGEKYKKGLEKWMSSALRATLNNGKNKDFALVPTS